MQAFSRLFSVDCPPPAVTAAIAVHAIGAAIEVDASPTLDAQVSLSGTIRHDPDIDLLVLPIGGREDAAHISGSGPLREIVDATAVVLSVGESLHECIIPSLEELVKLFLVVGAAHDQQPKTHPRGLELFPILFVVWQRVENVFRDETGREPCCKGIFEEGVEVELIVVFHACIIQARVGHVKRKTGKLFKFPKCLCPH